MEVAGIQDTTHCAELWYKGCEQTSDQCWKGQSLADAMRAVRTGLDRAGYKMWRWKGES